MKALSLIVAGLTVFSGAALAQEATEFDYGQSTLSRAAVSQQVQQARVGGSLSDGGEATVYSYSQGSSLTRAEVRDQIAQARAEGSLIDGGEAGISVDHQ
ncbi:MAG TPA: hypothetical protein VFR86_16995 [Burkholderiaceae bacterium]|nr:hypothetical protein [Burkholderiaceae bacterium]